MLVYAGRATIEAADDAMIGIKGTASQELRCPPDDLETVRNRLSLGGNICGRLFYREAILPLLVSEAVMLVGSQNGIRRVPILNFFDKKANLKDGEILLQVEVDKKYITLPFFNKRKEKQGKIDYPMFHLVALKVDENIRFAFSGICSYPFRSIEMENFLNDDSKSHEERADYAIENLPTSIRNDIYAPNEFRKYLFKNALISALEELEGEE